MKRRLTIEVDDTALVERADQLGGIGRQIVSTYLLAVVWQVEAPGARAHAISELKGYGVEVVEDVQL